MRPGTTAIILQAKCRREVRLTKTCTGLSLCYVLCWFPFVVLHCIRSFIGTKHFELLFYVSIWLGWVNSALNPIIYYSNYEVSIYSTRYLSVRRFKNHICCCHHFGNHCSSGHCISGHCISGITVITVLLFTKLQFDLKTSQIILSSSCLAIIMRQFHIITN